MTIQPWNGHRNPLSALFHLIENVSPSEFQEIVRVGENNTYPFLSRIQSQCGVERTLDRCVHRLRERIFKSNASVPAIAEEFAAESKPVTGRTAEQGMYKLDRTPSFYTSRSVVNLHELSVGDPLKTQVTQPASVDSVENFLPDIVGESGYAILSMPLQTNEETADALSAAGMERSRSSSRIPYLGTESVGNDAKGDAPVVDEARASGLTRYVSMLSMLWLFYLFVERNPWLIFTINVHTRKTRCTKCSFKKAIS